MWMHKTMQSGNATSKTGQPLLEGMCARLLVKDLNHFHWDKRMVTTRAKFTYAIHTACIS